MAQQNLNVGTAANDGSGDPLRTAAQKIEANTTELYTTKAPLASPAFTGTPTAPTATAGTNTTQLATTAFVSTAVAAGGGGGTGDLSFTTKTASYTLVLADANTMVEMNLAAANTLTIPLNSAVSFPINTLIAVRQYGIGATTIAGTTGVTLRQSSTTLTLRTQYSEASLHKRGTDEWVVSGDLT